MHYHAEVWLPNLYNLDEALQTVMEPHKEGQGNGGFWDWYQVGGRYTGRHSTYKPEEDPANWETCQWCEGTGLRNDQLGRSQRETDPSYTCNGCGKSTPNGWENGHGRALKWPTQWRRVDAVDVMPLEQVPDDLTAYTVVTPDKAISCETWDGNDWKKNPEFDGGLERGGSVKALLTRLGVSGGFLVTVDYHS